MKIFDWKYFGIAAGLILGFALTHIFYAEVLCFTKSILNVPDLNLYAGGVATIFTILQKIKSRKIEFKKIMSIKEFSASIGDIISFIDNPILIIGSLTMVKGLFFQITEDIQFIPLKGVELTFIIIVTLYLLYSSLLELWNNISGTCWKDKVISDTPHKVETPNETVPEPPVTE